MPTRPQLLKSFKMISKAYVTSHDETPRNCRSVLALKELAGGDFLCSDAHLLAQIWPKAPKEITFPPMWDRTQWE